MLAADVWTMHDVGAVWLLMWVLFLGAIVWAVVGVARDGREDRPSDATESPLELLDRRLADGTLTPDDYERRRSLLTAPGADAPIDSGNGSTAPRTPEDVTA